MKVYETTYSRLNNYNKKEQKSIESNFPFTTLNSNFNAIDLCGQKVDKATDFELTSKFCPLCDSPMIVKMQYVPCDHVVCYSCSKPDNDTCYVCNSKFNQIKRLPDNMKLFECDYPDCFKFFESYDKLFLHKQVGHGVSV